MTTINDDNIDPDIKTFEVKISIHTVFVVEARNSSKAQDIALETISIEGDPEVTDVEELKTAKDIDSAKRHCNHFIGD